MPRRSGRFEAISTLDALRCLLDGDTDGAASDPVRPDPRPREGGRPIDQLPRRAALSKSGVCSLRAEAAEQVGVGALRHSIWPVTRSHPNGPSRIATCGCSCVRSCQIRARFRPRKPATAEAWRGLWRIVNLFQGARGLHVEFDGLDTLAPPDMADPVEQGIRGPGLCVEEARALCDDAFHQLIERADRD